VYIDGVKQTLTQSAGTTALNVNANDEFFLGCQQGGSKPLNGSISNFKLWNIALTADEVAAEYALGRTGKALNVTDTAVCLGGTAPRAQLDVRGTGMFEGSLVTNDKVGIGTMSPSTALDVTGGYGYFRQGTMIGDYGLNGHTQHRTHIVDGSGSQTLYQVFQMKKNNNWIPGVIKVYWAKTNANSGGNAGNYAIWRYYRYSASGMNTTLIAGSASSITVGYSTAGSLYDEIQITLSGTERIIADIEVSDVYGFIM
tara:strand:- start:443 stop:1210 length:768 start_codon:yes stop_codon:yes gene_type:complete